MKVDEERWKHKVVGGEGQVNGRASRRERQHTRPLQGGILSRWEFQSGTVGLALVVLGEARYPHRYNAEVDDTNKTIQSSTSPGVHEKTLSLESSR